jgi:hypothetical protein
MCEEQPPQASKAGTAAQQLTLRSLAAIYQDACIAGGNQQAWMTAVGRWNARGGAQESQIEHCRWLSSAGVDVGSDISLTASPTNVSRPLTRQRAGQERSRALNARVQRYLDDGCRIRCRNLSALQSAAVGYRPEVAVWPCHGE